MSKLVRDNIPDIIKQQGGHPKTHIASNDEYWTRLKDKLLEEVNEFNAESSEEELADILEVLDAIIEHKNFDKLKIQATKYKKAKERGRFEKRIILD